VICQSGLTNCNGICVDLRTDINHCGICSNKCSGLTGICRNGQCIGCGDYTEVTYNYTGIYQSFIVPACGNTLIIEAWGGQGGAKGSATGGNGAYIKGNISVVVGEKLSLSVGGKGADGVCSLCAGGGGGGSFVVRASNNTPLIIAGGGGGASSVTHPGTDGSDTVSSTGGAFGTNSSGQGGKSDNANGTGAGGGGWFSAGSGNSGATGGSAAGGAGGMPPAGYTGRGGFGGGGAGWQGGGGGGGYSGGSSGVPTTGGGGGGSINNGSEQVNKSGANSGHGKIVITWTAWDWFSGGDLLNQKQMQQINTWNGSPKQNWTLCYKRSIHGANAAAFHSRCDSKGPTMTVILVNKGTTNERLIGGYASVQWNGSGYVGNSSNFLFSLTNNYKHAWYRYTYYQYNHPSYGPTWGGGHDFYTNLATSTYCNLGHDYTCRIGSYGIDTCRDDFCGIYQPTLSEVEVYYKSN
jgi:hypothetical protein